MKRNLLMAVAVILMVLPATVLAQGVKEFLEKTSEEKLQKYIDVTHTPVTAGGFGDGHGRNPVLTSWDQVPDTVALISFYINDYGTVKEGPYSISSYWITEAGGNEVANQIEKQVMLPLKAVFKKHGVVLLTPAEFLNTPQKRKYYYDTFVPKVSKLANFLGGIETKHVDTSVGANYYRPFDVSVCWDAIRAESLVDDLGKNLGVKGLLTIGTNLQTDKKEITMLGVRMALNGPNPIPKEDKRYVAQNMGNGYYFGQIYVDCAFNFPKPVLIGQYENIKKNKKSKEVTSTGIGTYKVTSTSRADIGLNVEGMETIMQFVVDQGFEAINNSISKAAQKYAKK